MAHSRIIDQTSKIERASVPALDDILGVAFPVLDHGFVRVVGYDGNDSAIVQSARVSYGEGTKTVSEDTALIRYLMRNRHTSPFESCTIRFHVKLPIFVARQWMRHRTGSFNEVSGRYSIMPEATHLPEPEDLARQSDTNRQGRTGAYDPSVIAEIRAAMSAAAVFTRTRYNTLIQKFDLARETAREVLPLSTYTEFYWRTDLHNLLHFLELRLDSHAQFEIREYARAICSLCRVWVPHTMNAARDYRFDAVTINRGELDALRAMTSHLTDEDLRRHVEGRVLSEREVTDFIGKLRPGA